MWTCTLLKSYSIVNTIFHIMHPTQLKEFAQSKHWVFVRTCSAGSICRVRVVESFLVSCFLCTDADPATLPGGNWLTSHQRSATLHCWLEHWSVFGNVGSPSLQFLCQLRFLSDTGALWLVAIGYCFLAGSCSLGFCTICFFENKVMNRCFSNDQFIVDVISAGYFHPVIFSWLWKGIMLCLTSSPPSVLPLKSLNTWLLWCISQLAAGNPQSCMSSEVNGFVNPQCLLEHAGLWESFAMPQKQLTHGIGFSYVL